MHCYIARSDFVHSDTDLLRSYGWHRSVTYGLVGSLCWLRRHAALAQDVGPALTAGRETDVAKCLPVYESNVQPQAMKCIPLVFLSKVNNLKAIILYEITQYKKSIPFQKLRPLWRHKFVCRCWQHSRTELYDFAVNAVNLHRKGVPLKCQRLLESLCEVFLTTFHV